MTTNAATHCAIGGKQFAFPAGLTHDDWHALRTLSGVEWFDASGRRCDAPPPPPPGSGGPLVQRAPSRW